MVSSLELEAVAMISKVFLIYLNLNLLLSSLIWPTYDPFKLMWKNEVAWVQSGAIMGELYYEIAQKSGTLAFPSALCHGVAFGRYTSGGGYGLLFRKYGLAADNVIDAEFIDANGRILKQKINGGRSVLGYSWRRNYRVSFLVATPSFKTKSDYVKKPIPEIGFQGIWSQLFEPEARGATLNFVAYGGKMDEIPESAVAFPHRKGNLYKISYKIRWREEDNVNSERYIAWMRRLYSYMKSFVSKSPREAYVNYRDLDIGKNNEDGYTTYAQMSTWGRKYFKNNFDRLVKIKTKIDPENFFRHEQSISPYFG
ncbi:hypothetical protein Goklo_018837 [Gossypium klotzschianum]|uniref:FAD-binding PCMH-type domain-containing protein n=1 Tax=Gossypium klotzschianum TaxID=34286 RepID=A0A7J8UMP5_9ROSI|nr:hypothetical protein [Gossypium klotzschianum]